MINWLAPAGGRLKPQVFECQSHELLWRSLPVPRQVSVGTL